MTIASWLSPPPPISAVIRHNRKATQARTMDADMKVKDCSRALSSSWPSSNRPNPKAKTTAATLRSIETDVLRTAIASATGAARAEIR